MKLFANFTQTNGAAISIRPAWVMAVEPNGGSTSKIELLRGGCTVKGDAQEVARSLEVIAEGSTPGTAFAAFTQTNGVPVSVRPALVMAVESNSNSTARVHLVRGKYNVNGTVEGIVESLERTADNPMPLTEAGIHF